jgi:hypothetical protein
MSISATEALFYVLRHSKDLKKKLFPLSFVI